jgi:hypothetical protein
MAAHCFTVAHASAPFHRQKVCAAADGDKGVAVSGSYVCRGSALAQKKHSRYFIIVQVSRSRMPAARTLHRACCGGGCMTSALPYTLSALLQCPARTASLTDWLSHGHRLANRQLLVATFHLKAKPGAANDAIRHSQVSRYGAPWALSEVVMGHGRAAYGSSVHLETC